MNGTLDRPPDPTMPLLAPNRGISEDVLFNVLEGLVEEANRTGALVYRAAMGLVLIKILQRLQDCITPVDAVALQWRRSLCSMLLGMGEVMLLEGREAKKLGSEE